jgi:hypothetical protein
MLDETVRELDGALSHYYDVSVADDHVTRLLTEIFSKHWADVRFGPLIEGSAWEIQLTSAPTLTMHDGYLTVDTGAWHFHLCVERHRGRGDETLAAIRRVSRAAFVKSEGGTCVPVSFTLKLWNGRGEPMITIFFPNPYYDHVTEKRRREPDWTCTALWDELKARYNT